MVGHIDLLPQLFSTVVIPEVVYQELLANGEEHLVTRTVTTAVGIEIRATSDRARAIALERDRQLDPGEANAISVISKQ